VSGKNAAPKTALLETTWITEKGVPYAKAEIVAQVKGVPAIVNCMATPKFVIKS